MSDLHSAYVPPTGPLTAKIILLGESPGVNEAQQGEPFIGAAGHELDQLLASASIRRRDCYITNTVKYLPRGKGKDKAKEFFSAEGAPTQFYMSGIIELFNEIKAVRAAGGGNVIVPLGNYALWALRQHQNIMRYRGSILESTLIKGLKVIPTIHPAYYTYRDSDYGDMHNFRLLGHWDFIRIAKQAEFPEIIRPQYNFIINPDSWQIEEAIDKYTSLSLDHVTADTEWYSPDKLAYIAFGTGNEAICITPNSMLAYRAIKEICESSVPKVWQNAMFDATALYRRGIKVKNVAHDTMIAWFFNWGTVVGKNRLDVISSVLTEQPYYKDDVDFVGVDDRGQEYCCTDVAVTEAAHVKMQEEEFEITGTRRGYEISMSLMNTMIGAAQFGILVDRRKLKALRADRERLAAEANERVFKATGERVNCRSWPQIQRLVYDNLGLGKRFTERSTDQKVLMGIAATLYAENPESKVVKILIDVIRERQALNENSRYINENIIDTDNRTRCNWNLAGTKNGRLSTTKPWWNGVALQTMPEDAREICVADPGHCFVGWDLAQAEARIVAVLSHDFELLDAMGEGKDIHVLLASKMPFGMTFEEIQAEVAAAVAEGKSKDSVVKRYLSKRTRHASNYIQSWKGLQTWINRYFLDTMIGVDAATAKLLSSGFLAASPGLPAWWKEVLDTINTEGYLINAFGRRRNWYERAYLESHEHKDAVAFYPQSTVADLTSISIAEVDKHNWIQVLIHAHDGGLVQVREKDRDAAIEVIKNTMTREFLVKGTPLTIPVDLKWGYDWKNLKSVK